MKFFTVVSKFILYFLLNCFCSFTFIRLIPGDPALNLVGERGATEERLKEIKIKMGLNESLFIQFYKFTKNALAGDFGESLVSKNSIIDEFKILFPATMELTLIALIWSSLLGVFLGVLSAARKYSILDYIFLSISTLGFSMPLFWWALICILIFSVQLQWLPVSGRINVIYDIPFVTGFNLIDSIIAKSFDGFLSSLLHLILPTFVLGAIPLALIFKVTRSTVIETFYEDFVRTARSKGLSDFKILFKHVLKFSLPQIITAIGLALGQLMTGAILTETIFSWPGMGRWIVKGIEARDYPVVQAGIFYAMLAVLFINSITDFCVQLVRPKNS